MSVPGTFLRNEEQESPSDVPRSYPPMSGTGNTGADDLFVNVAALLDGGLPQPPERVVCARNDGECLFYEGQVNYLFGDPESGKTFLGIAGCAEALTAGWRIVIIDLDHNGPAATLNRLLLLGAPIAALRDPDLFRYVEPEDREHLMAVVTCCKEWLPNVALVDSIGELLPILNLSSNSPDDFTIAHSSVLKPLAMIGAAVIAIDHLAKGTDSRAVGPTGTAAKRRSIGGVSLRVVVKEPFTPGKGGKAILTINKDRHGGLRGVCPAPESGEAFAGTFLLEEANGETTWRVLAPKEGEQAKTPNADAAALALLQPAPTTVRDVKLRMSWGGTRATDAFKAYQDACSPFPDIGGRNREHACRVCGLPLVAALVNAGETTHASCDPVAA